MGEILADRVQNRVRGPGNLPLSSIRSRSDLPDATRASISGTPAGIVFSIYVAVLIMLRSAGTSPFCRNVRTADRHITFFIHNDFRKATIPLSSFHGLPGLGWAASQNATALAFISRLIST